MTIRYFIVKATGTYIGGFDVPDVEAELTKQKFSLADIQEVPFPPDHALQKWNGNNWGAKVSATDPAINASLAAYAAELQSIKK